MGFCNSCGRPVFKGEFGTNEDGSENEEYCKDCFQNGEFTEPDLDVNEVIIRTAKSMIEKNPMLREEDATGLLINFIPHLKRWCPDPDEEELFNEEDKPMGYRTYME